MQKGRERSGSCFGARGDGKGEGEVTVRAWISVWFVRGSAFYNLTVAKEQGPYAGNQQHQYRPPQAASHISLQVHINRVRESICSYSRTNKQTINQNEKPSYQYNIDDAM